MLAPVPVKHKKRAPLGDKVLTRLVFVVSVVYPMSAIPQLIKIIEGDARGVSVISWLSFCLCAALFLVYGLRHKVMPMIVSNILWVLIDGLVVVSLLVTHTV